MTAQVLRFPPIQTAARDPRVRNAIAGYAQRQDLLRRIRRQRAVIGGLLVVIGLMVGWWPV